MRFEEIAAEFAARTARITLCTVASVDGSGRPRTRMLHPIWEGTTGWIATRPGTLLEKHLAANPHVSIQYWDQKRDKVIIEARTEWADDPATRHRIWALYKSTPEPQGYDLGDGYFTGPDGADFRLLKLNAWRIKLDGRPDAQGNPPFRGVWRANET